MQIWLHQLDGSCLPLTLENSQQLLDLAPASARLILQGSHLAAHNADSLLFENANVYVVGSLEGGKKKKKKKVYTTKKKNKHIHKRVKLGIYNLYSIDGKGTVSQQRKTCPSCGPGTFMAQHWDRYYCGFCHTTIKMDAETVKKNEEIMRKKKAALEAEKKAK
jgi:small subunit ribosomal protein S27Ae